jgi:hypothetical protein
VVPTGNPKWLTSSRESVEFIWCAIAGLFRSRAALQAEILLPPGQCSVPLMAEAGGPWQNQSPGILRALSLAPTVLDALNILQPETVISVGIALVSELIGAGDHDGAAAGQGSPRTFAILFAR